MTFRFTKVCSVVETVEIELIVHVQLMYVQNLLLMTVYGGNYYFVILQNVDFFFYLREIKDLRFLFPFPSLAYFFPFCS